MRYILNGPKKIIAEWLSLNTAGFKTIDCILPNLTNREEAYFFRVDQYTLINIQKVSSFSSLCPQADIPYRTKQCLHHQWP